MTTPTKGVPITLDKERRLRYSLADIRKVEERFGVDLLGGEADAFEPKSVADISWLIWLGLRHEDAEVTPEVVEGHLYLDSLDTLMEAMGRAMGGGFTPNGQAPEKVRAGNA